MSLRREILSIRENRVCRTISYAASAGQLRLSAFNAEDNSTELAELKSMVDTVYSTNGWAIIFFHNIKPNDHTTPYTTSSQDFASFLDYTISKCVQTLTVNQALDYLT